MFSIGVSYKLTDSRISKVKEVKYSKWACSPRVCINSSRKGLDKMQFYRLRVIGQTPIQFLIPLLWMAQKRVICGFLIPIPPRKNNSISPHINLNSLKICQILLPSSKITIKYPRFATATHQDPEQITTISGIFVVCKTNSWQIF